jgi:rare lipoprotein A
MVSAAVWLATRRTARAAVAVTAAALLASCAGSAPDRETHFPQAQWGKASQRVVAENSRRVPDGGGRYMVGEPYRVAGKTYIPQDDPDGYTATGLASWYGSRFHGRRTANGEVYDMRDLSAAHPTLPLPSYARVTNLANGRSVVVRVNDRGPFTHGRIIDVSSQAASMLDFRRAGVAKVRVDYLGPARLDGKDDAMLMASYRGPGAVPAPATMVAANSHVVPKPTVIAANTRTRPSIDFSVADEGGAFDAGPAAAFSDPLAPLILKTGFASSYAPVDANRFTPAHAAAADLAAQAPSDALADLDRRLAAATTLQIGAFADPGNADRAARRFAAFGKVAMRAAEGRGQALQVVFVTVTDPSVSPEVVIAAAEQAGLHGVRVVSPAR